MVATIDDIRKAWSFIRSAPRNYVRSHFEWQEVLAAIEWQAFLVVAKPGVAEESSDMAGRIYSTYIQQQEKCIKDGYTEKLNYVGPEVDLATPCSDSLPEVEYPDIYNCLINTPKPVTKEELKA